MSVGHVLILWADKCENMKFFVKHTRFLSWHTCEINKIRFLWLILQYTLIRIIPFILILKFYEHFMHKIQYGRYYRKSTGKRKLALCRFDYIGPLHFASIGPTPFSTIGPMLFASICPVSFSSIGPELVHHLISH